MSALTSPSRPQAPSRPASRPIRALPAPRPGAAAAAGPASGVGFVVTCAALLVATLLGLLGLNVAISANAFTLAALESQQKSLSDKEDAARVAVADAASPERLDARARSLGMVAVDSPASLPARSAADATAAGTP